VLGRFHYNFRVIDYEVRALVFEFSAAERAAADDDVWLDRENQYVIEEGIIDVM